MELIRVTRDNLEDEHICCAISDNRDVQVLSKKAWLKNRFDDGLVFLKGNVRGKCFIEYLPAEAAFAPVAAAGYMYIDCLWVSGQFKGHGNANLLLDACIRDSQEKGKKGLVILSSKKKAGFLSDPKFMKYKGFTVADTAAPYFELLYLPFDQQAPLPAFRETVKSAQHADMPDGFSLYYSDQCPFTAKYVPLLCDIAAAHRMPLHTVHLETAADAQNAPSPFTTFSLFYNGVFVTHEILSEKKFENLLAEKQCACK